MKALILDIEGEGTGVDLAVRAQDAGHEVRYWLPTTNAGNRIPYGDGLLDKPREWEPSMKWADLIVTTGNSKYHQRLGEYFAQGYPLFAPNQKSAELELDRKVGQEVLKKHGIYTVPYTVVKSADEGIAHIAKTKKAYAMKPWGGDGDKSMTYVSSEPDDGIYTLMKWKKEGKFKGQLMLQEKMDGVEMGISGWFGPGGWNSSLEESFEHKKFLNEDLGENTGEMGTVIRHVEHSKLFDLVLEPLTDYLHMCHYVGDCSVNCIIGRDGSVAPLEFTMRLGWPDFCIRQEVIKSDPIEWMRDLLYGKDTLRVSSKVAVGVLLAHGDFPKGGDPTGTWAGYPIRGITDENYKHVHFQQVAVKESPWLKGGRVVMEDGFVTAGNYVMVVTGSSDTVSAAAQKATDLAWEIKWPSNVMFRTDIGKRLEHDLPILQRHGFAAGMKY